MCMIYAYIDKQVFENLTATYLIISQFVKIFCEWFIWHSYLLHREILYYIYIIYNRYMKKYCFE